MEEYILKRDTISKDGEIISSSTRQFYNPFKAGRGYNFKYKSNNIRKYLDIPLPRVFSAAETGRIFWLVEKIDPESNLLAKKLPGKELEPISRNDIQKIVGLSSRSKFSVFFNKLLRYKLLKLTPTLAGKFYCFNPIYFNATKYLPIHAYITFRKELSEYLPQWITDEYLSWAEEIGVALEGGKPNEKCMGTVDGQTKNADDGVH